MRIDSREMLAVGICGRSRIGNRLEALLRGGHFTARASVSALIASAFALGGLMIAGSLVPRWIAFAQNRSAFDAVSIKPNLSATDQVELGRPAGNRMVATNVSLRMLIKRAYKVKEFALTGGPDWAGSMRFDISATVAGSAIMEPEFKAMLQALLTDRFHLRVHRETRSMPVYALVALKNGVAPASPAGQCLEQGAPPPATPLIPCGGFFVNNGEFEGRRVTVTQLVSALSDLLDRPVLDKTGYKGAFDFHMEFAFEGIAPYNGGGFGTPALPAEAPSAETKPTIFSAIQQQLGMKLESTRGTDEVLVIDHAEKPDAN